MGTISGTHKVRGAQTLSTSQRTLNPLENQPIETLLFKEHLKNGLLQKHYLQYSVPI